MKTNLDREIKSLDEANEFIQDLIDNKEIWHPEDSIFDIAFDDYGQY